MENKNWLEDAQKEAQQLGPVLFANFKFAMEQCIKYAPDQLNVETRARVFEAVVQAWVGAFVNPIATFANSTKQIEQMICDEIRLKFEWIRENEKELQLARLDKMAEDRKNQIGLILAPKG